MADPVQTRAKAERRAAALRANLKRRKEQGRDPERPVEEPKKSTEGDAKVPPAEVSEPTKCQP